MAADVPTISAERLAPVVRRLLDAPDAWPAEWSFERLDVELYNPATSGVYRVFGKAALGLGETRPWRLILKVVVHPDLSGTPVETGYLTLPEDWNYWKREVLTFRSGLLDRFDAPLRAVRCWGTEEVDESTAWLWLEELDQTVRRTAQPHAELAQAAHAAGAFAAQGTGMVEEVQRLPWAAHQWVRGWFGTSLAWGAQHAVEHEGCWQHPLVRHRLPSSARRDFADFVAVADRLLDRLESLPLTVAHHDLKWNNLFPQPGGDRTVAIDWSFFGTAPVGEDLGHQIVLDVFLGAVPPHHAEEYERAATEAYLTGLRSSGWQGGDADVRFAAVASGALQMLPFAVTYLADLCPAFGGVDPWHERRAEQQGLDVDTVMDHWCEAYRYVASMAARARHLVDGA